MGISQKSPNILEKRKIRKPLQQAIIVDPKIVVYNSLYTVTLGSLPKKIDYKIERDMILFVALALNMAYDEQFRTIYSMSMLSSMPKFSERNHAEGGRR